MPTPARLPSPRHPSLQPPALQASWFLRPSLRTRLFPGSSLGAWLWWIALGLASLGHNARAQAPCLDEPPDVEMTPGSQASEVALDAPLIVRFREPVLPRVVTRQTLRLLLEDEDRVVDAGVDDPEAGAVAGQLQRLGPHVLAFVPEADLMPRKRYRAVLEVPGASRERQWLFETGRERDQQAPEVFFDEDEVDLRSGEAAEECGLPEGSYLVDLAVPAAVDDADNGALDYYLYLTRAQGLAGPVLLARTRREGASAGVVFRFVLTAEQTEEPICTSLRVIDGVGRQAEAEPELCFDPRQGTYFQPLCSASGGGGAQARPPLAVALGFLVAWCFIRGWRGRSRC